MPGSSRRVPGLDWPVKLAYAQPMPRRFVVEVLGENGAIQIVGMKSWVRLHPELIPPGKDADSLNSHQVRDFLRKRGWGHRVTEADEILVSPEVQHDAPTEPTDEIDDAPVEGTVFAYESHLRDFLAKHLELLEPGLVPWGADAVEYALGSRRIDILAKDRGGIPVIIELKVSRGHERVVGQALYYRARLKQVLAVPGARIMIVAGEVTPELRLAVSEIADVALFEYSLSMSVRKI